MHGSSFGRGFLDLFKSGRSSESEILHLMNEKYDKEYTNYTFFIHFFFYFLIILPPFFELISSIIPYLLSITIVRLILVIVSLLKKYKLSYAIYISGVISDALFYIIIGITIQSHPSIENFYLTNAYLMVSSILILLYSLRLQKFSCVFSGAYFVIFHIVYVILLPQSIISETQLFSRIFPIITFIGASVIGSVFIFNKRRNLSDLYRYSEERRAMQQELELAKKVQDALFPKESKIHGLKYKYYRKNPNVIGGDFFDFVQLREGNVGVFLTDVAGHGISSAMVASIMKVLVSTIPYRFKLSPVRLLEYLDERLVKDLNRYHASAVYLFFDFLEKRLTIGNAGHPYLIHCPREKEFVEIETEGAILGFNIRSPIVSEKIVSLSSGDRFVIYTDGLIECATSQGEELGSDGFLQILNRNKNIELLPDLEKAILLDLKTEFGIESFSDDMMFLLIELD
ncbi:MAG: PP2C family protein-serine/threonine phosphatase [Leptospira sp.]|nr:PP2C family protein-serine/threonine phosphatase [Leptospira sp.]